MSQITITKEYEALLDVVRLFPDGARIDQIEAQLESPPARRTLQRRLNELIHQRRLQKKEQTRATRYFFRIDRASTQAMDDGSHIPLSDEGEQLL